MRPSHKVGCDKCLSGRGTDERLWEFQKGGEEVQLEGREQALDPRGISVPQTAKSMRI